ncbi:hypothetical protein K504DRAFT_499394 [Pleomassaria siparia CBS 279.74]|uniref:F-box domain-containing protein n=1 Tax=Pleomassaria siparia CBS 279.74 TaxID=1314801 RepID=A0A6G1KII5_9PLEO|nr:hypothetical protein K504DRAFT_499394 [Pleomassaria siparia CBS 279.74]
MRQSLDSRRDLLEPQHAFRHRYEATRPDISSTTEDHNRISSESSSQRTSLSNSSKHFPPSSMNSYTNRPVLGYDYETPRLTQTPWERERYKKNSTWRRSKVQYPFSAQVSKKFPREVYNYIVDQLAQLHFEVDEACPCYLRDLHSLSLTSRAWYGAVTPTMYRKAWVLTNENHPNMLKLKIKGSSRLKVLRRTLRERSVLAQYVQELHMTEHMSLYQDASIEREEIVNLVASVVMACPNLERLVGFHVPYTHSFDRLSHALSTRRKLKERVWLLTENPYPEFDDEEEDLSNNYYNAACDPMERFLELHSTHPSLTTLVLHQEQSCLSVPLNFRAIVGTFRQLPALRHLSISGLSTSSFTTMTLNALPPYLKSLRLENLPGVSDKGIQRFAASYLATSLESIVLIDLEVSSLVTISTIMSTKNLRHFILAQDIAPTLRSVDDVPILQSKTLQYIHWEIRSQVVLMNHHSTTSFPFSNTEPVACLAMSILSTHIRNGLFPSLRKICAPHDPQGLLQTLCKPPIPALPPSDILTLLSRQQSSGPSSSHKCHMEGLPSFSFTDISVDLISSTPGSLLNLSPKVQPSSPMSSIFDISPSSSHSKNNSIPDRTSASSPLFSRVAAEAHIVSAHRKPLITVRVTKPEGDITLKTAIGGFLGKHDSNIVYEMWSDRSQSRDLEGAECVSDWITGVAGVAGIGEVNDGEGYETFCKRGHRVMGNRVVRLSELF